MKTKDDLKNALSKLVRAEKAKAENERLKKLVNTITDEHNAQEVHIEDILKAKEIACQYKTEKRILLKAIDGYKRIIDKMINSKSYPLSDDLMILSMEMERKLQEIKK